MSSTYPPSWRPGDPRLPEIQTVVPCPSQGSPQRDAWRSSFDCVMPCQLTLRTSRMLYFYFSSLMTPTDRWALDLHSNTSPSITPSVPARSLCTLQTWDMCKKHACSYFALTTYDERVFGVLNLGAFQPPTRLTDTGRHASRTGHTSGIHVRPFSTRHTTVFAKDVTLPRFRVQNVFEMPVL